METEILAEVSGIKPCLLGHSAGDKHKLLRLRFWKSRTNLLCATSSLTVNAEGGPLTMAAATRIASMGASLLTASMSAMGGKQPFENLMRIHGTIQQPRMADAMV